MSHMKQISKTNQEEEDTLKQSHKAHGFLFEWEEDQQLDLANSMRKKNAIQLFCVILCLIDNLHNYQPSNLHIERF
jgi:hypothetical protein